MTRKDYVALARAFAAVRGANAIDAAQVREAVMDGEDVAEYMEAATQHAEGAVADTLAADNPRFDRERFLDACRAGA